MERDSEDNFGASAEVDSSELQPSSADDVELVLSAQLNLNAVQITGNVRGLAGGTYQGQSVPQCYRAISLPQSNDLYEWSEYIMVNNDTQTIQSYDLDEISAANLGGVLGISVLILTAECIKEGDSTVRYAVLQSLFLGQPCFLGTGLPEGLGLVVFEEMDTRFTKKECSAKGYHGLVVPLEPVTLDNFISRFTQASWTLCQTVAGGCPDEEAETDENHPISKIPLTDANVKLSQLIRLLNVFGEKLNGSAGRASNIIRSAVQTVQSKTFEALAADMDVAIAIHIFLHHLNTTIDVLKKVDVAISIQSLQDSLNDLHRFDEEWTVVNIAKRVDKSLLLLSPVIAISPI